MIEPEMDMLQKIRRYHVVRPIGRGGMGQVYLATDKIIRRPVAIKAFELHRLPQTGPAKKKIMRDFFLEIQAAGALLHPNIVVIYDVGKQEDLLYMVMEFVYGKTLLEHHRSARLSVKRCVEIVYELALALEYAHGQGVVHRDIKPENIILSAHGVPKLTDFGIARFRSHLKEKRETIRGSARFMSPEQVLRQPQDHRVDIYQLGVVLYGLLTRQNPFKGATPEDTLKRVCTVIPESPATLNPSIPADLDSIVVRCLEKSPARRFSRAMDLAEALGGCLKAGIHPAAPVNDELVNRLKKFDMFSLFSEQEIQEIVKVGKFISCKAGEHIITENEGDSNFFVLLDGNVKVVKRSRILTDFLPGSCFGAIGAFARQKRSAAVVAEANCRLLQINALLFQHLDPRLQLKMLNIVVRDMARLVMSLDDKISQISEGMATDKAPVKVCPLCGFDNQAPLEMCPRCGVIPSRFVEEKSTTLGADPPDTGHGIETAFVGAQDPTETMDDALWPQPDDSSAYDAEEIEIPDDTVEIPNVPEGLD